MAVLIIEGMSTCLAYMAAINIIVIKVYIAEQFYIVGLCVGLESEYTLCIYALS